MDHKTIGKKLTTILKLQKCKFFCTSPVDNDKAIWLALTSHQNPQRNKLQVNCCEIGKTTQIKSNSMVLKVILINLVRKKEKKVIHLRDEFN